MLEWLLEIPIRHSTRVQQLQLRLYMLFTSNVDGTNDATVDLLVTDNSLGSDFYILKTVDVPADSSLVIEKPINLEANDILKVKASAAGDLQAFASVLEMT